MTFIQRLGYYSGGLVLGIIAVAFFFSGKKSSCDYSPTSRVLKNIRIKNRFYTTESLSYIATHNIDTASISSLLENGKVNEHHVQLKLNIENCNKKATILSIKKLN